MDVDGRRQAGFAIGRICQSGGSWAMRIRTSSGCRATSARAFTAPPLVAKISTAPVRSVEISRCTSSACSSGVFSAVPSVR